VRPGDRITLACVDLDDEGAGVGAGEPRVHVAGLLPGERAEARVEHVSSHRPEAWARLEQLEAPSPARRVPVCPAFGACGGCVLQHLDYQAQLDWKGARLARALGGRVAVAPCVASPRPLGYRNQSKLVVARSEGRPPRLVLGAYVPRSHAVVDVAGCRIVEPPLDAVAARLRDVLEEQGASPFDERTRAGELRYAVLRSNHRGQVLAVLVTARPDRPWVATVAARLRAACPEVVGVVENVNRAAGNVIQGDEERVALGAGALDERVGGVALRLSPRAFFQVNRDVAALAYAAIARALAVGPRERVVDAYAGAGGIALSLAPAAGEVLGIEEHPAAVADAVAAAALNGAANVRFVAGDAAAELARLDRADALVLNPPRKGCAPAVLAEAARMEPRAIAYLSCDPDTLARDLTVLEGLGYAAREVTPFDMHPHTPHVEALAVLARASG
jgi:23S rRNA (uracil1939-C5)-methyltransferase